MKKYVLPFLFTLVALAAQANVVNFDLNVSGKVTDFNGSPIAGAAVLLTINFNPALNYSNTVYADVNGDFSDVISVPDSQSQGVVEAQTDCGNNDLITAVGFWFGDSTDVYLTLMCPDTTNSGNCSAFAYQDSSGADSLCFIGVFSTGTPPFSYLWSTGETTEYIIADATAEYCVTVTDASGCVAFSCVMNNCTPADCFVYIHDDPANAGTNLTAFPSGPPPFSYSWSTNQNTQSITVTAEGYYCVTVVDGDGCIAGSCRYIFVNNPDSCTASVVPLNTGAGQQLCAYSTGPGPYAYLWSTGENTFTIDIAIPGDYCVTVTDANGCEASTCYTYNGGSPNACYVAIAYIQNNVLIAYGDSLAVLSYQWSTGETTQQIDVSQSGIYCVTVTYVDSCIAENCFVLSFNDCPLYVYEFESPAGGGLGASSGGTAPFSYYWSNGEVTEQILLAQSGSYCVTVVDADSCFNSVCYFYSGTGQDSCGVAIIDDAPSGNLLLAIANGVAPFAFNWNTGETTAGISVQDTGYYCVTVTDATGCESSDCFLYGGTNAGNFIQGIVYLQDSFLLMGPTTVELYRLENGTATLVDQQFFTGDDYFRDYRFNNLEAGEYIVKASLEPGGTNADEFVPTYHLSEIMWDDAGVITLPEANNAINYYHIIMIPADGLVGNGPGAISGGVNDGDGLLSGGNNQLIGSAPLNGITILLRSETGAPLDFALTDAAGNFSFVNLPLGMYQVMIEVAGMKHANYWVNLTAENPEVSGLVFEVTPEGIFTGTYELANAGSLQVFPNPVQSLLFVQMDNSWTGDLQLRIYSVAGSVVQSWKGNGVDKIQIPVESLAAGTYFFLLNDSHQQASGKFVKR